MRAALTEVIARLIFLAGVGLLLFAGSVVVYQCVLWLQDGYWTSFQFRLAWEFFGGTEPPLLSWRGVERLRTWILDLPLSGGVGLCGVAVFWLGIIATIEAEADKPAKRNETRAD
jgi:hypothetical protein